MPVGVDDLERGINYMLKCTTRQDVYGRNFNRRDLAIGILADHCQKQKQELFHLHQITYFEFYLEVVL